MTPVTEIATADWKQACSSEAQEQAVQSLEAGSVLFLPRLRFSILETERPLLSLSTAGKSKYVSFDSRTGELRGGSLGGAEAKPLAAMMQRFAGCSKDLLSALLPHYKTSLSRSRTSFRPVEIAGRSTSWRKDDTRLHIDSFPSSPVQGKRILRVFSNIDPDGRSRSWRIGEPIEKVAGRYLNSLKPPGRASSRLLRLLRITKSRRTAYDHLMLQLHDRMKKDADYQSGPDQISFEFPTGSTWIVFTDQVPHAAMAGQNVLEQTFFLPVRGMMDQSKSPLRILERLRGETLV
jgi:hypothetical protein